MLELVETYETKLKVIEKKMSDPELVSNRSLMVELSRERQHVVSILEKGRIYRQVIKGIEEAQEIIAANEDQELTAMALDDLETYQAQLEDVEQEFKLILLPRDPNDDKSAIVEIRAGTGGDEAGIFVGDIFKMYQRYAESKNWKLEILSGHASISGGFKEIIFSLSGEKVYGLMKFESGVHRVQRVPLTETQGRIHTSAISVAVLAEAEEIDIEIKENEIKVDVYRSSGPGGQSVNTTDSAVRITHYPTGLVVTCQDEKSQLKNKNKAMKVLRARLYDIKMSEHLAKIDADRKSMISTGDRSAKIRTYNFPQSRVTDHRIGLTLYKLDAILQGDLTELIDALRQFEQARLLKMHENDGEKI